MVASPTRSSYSPATCRYPSYGPRRSSWEIFLPDVLPYGHPRRCWSWRCEGCGFLKSKDARSLVRIGLQHALDDGLPLILLTLTEPPEPRGYRASSKALTQVVKRLQARHGGSLRWIGVVEWQQRGAVHWHMIVAGLAFSRTVRNKKTGRVYPGHERGRFTHEVTKYGDLRPLVMRYGFGQVVDVHAVGTRPDDTACSLATYVAKYLTKTEDMKRLPKRAQPVRYSQGGNQWAPGVTLTGLRDEKREAMRARAVGEVA